MKKIIKNVFFVALSAFALGACKAELETTPVTTNGKIDLSKYVAVGNSLTAGFADGGVYLESQQNSYPQFLSEQFAQVGGGAFVQPLYASANANGSGYRTITGYGKDPITGNPTPIFANTSTNLGLTGTKLFGFEAPVPFPQAGKGEFQLIPYAGTGNQNLGIPGIAAVHMTQRGYSLLNPHFERLLTATQKGNGSPLIPTNGATYLEYVAASNPTFFTCWIGNNDVLKYASEGGDDTAGQGTGAITTPANFNGSYGALVNTLTAKGAKGVLATIPDISALPYFKLIGTNSISRIFITDGKAEIVFPIQTFGSPAVRVPVNFNAIFPAGLPALGSLFPGTLPNPTAAQVASWINARYLLAGFSDPGFIPGENFPAFIVDENATPKKVLKIDLANGDYIAAGPYQAGVGAQYGVGGGFLSLNPANPAASTLAARPLTDNLVLDATEVTKVRNATAGYNAYIKSVGLAKGLPVFDAATSFNEIIANNGIDEVVGSAAYISGGLFSLDGIHLTPRGYGTIANQFIKAINAGYNTNIPLLDVRQRGLRGVRLP